MTTAGPALGPLSYHARKITWLCLTKGETMATVLEAAQRGSAAPAKSYPIYVAGECQDSAEPLEVRSPFDNGLVGTTFQASRQQLEAAIDGAVRAFETT